MCEPTTILLIGTALSAGGAIYQGVAAKKAGEANARVASILAKDAIDRGEADAASQRRKTAAFHGNQLSKFAASGAEVNTGSSAEILADTQEFGKLDEERIRNNAEREAFSLLAGGSIAKAQGDAAFTSGILQAGGTALSGGSAVASKWQAFKVDNPGSSFGSFLAGTT